ncbi:Extracellular solute-binding protein [Burkholderia sp. 8Y]|uniref:ABC transporter substrate-binding protein n=1 Tax=Burkholderia sp. 8Y TaxID=2653133 RepID=UPI0012F1F3FE|nr:ABC transporter substrate-binding protein [Burkholderia sp. 8Y]VXC96779.1 Extracellular solute-binding protein [Burkholderia sp. 8Y]
MKDPNELPIADPSRRKAVKTLLAAGATSLILTRVPELAFAATEPAPKRGGWLRVAMANQSLADSLDPARGTHTGDYSRMYMFYSGLTELDADFHTQNALADKFESDDFTKWRLALKPNVHFHDGKPLTADDVVFSLMRHKNPATASKAKSIADNFSAMKATGSLTLEITLNEPNVDLPTLLAIPHFVIVAANTTDFSKGNGTGPFVCKAFTPAQQCIGARNPNFWKPGRPYLDEVEIIGVADDAARTNALLSGDVQLISPLPARDVERLKQTGTMTILESPSQLYSDLALRQDMIPTKSPDFVEGIKFLHDRQQIVRVMLRGHGTIANDHPVPEWHPYFMKGLPQRAFDPDRAQSCFKKLGASGARGEIIAPPSVETAIDSALMVQQAAKQAGADITVRRVPADGYWSTYWMKYPMTYGSILPRPTLDLLYTQFFQSNATWNESGWKNPQFDQLLVQARRERDDAKRKQLYGDMQTIIYEKNSLVIPAFINFIDGQSAKLRGLKGSPSGRLMGYRFAEFAWLDQA